MFSEIIGHTHTLKTLIKQYEAGLLPPTQLWLGSEGIGKCTAAKALATSILEESSSLHPAKSFVDKETHPNLFILRPLEDKKEISAEQAKSLLPFLTATPLYGGWRVVIVDAVDQLNRQAGNALLKVFEEPPKETLIILICHQVGKVLPTILSRTIKISFHPLSDEEMASHFKEFSRDILDIAEGRLGLAKALLSLDVPSLFQHMGKGLFLGLQKNYSGLQQHLATFDDTTQKQLLNILPHFFRRILNAPTAPVSEGIQKLLSLQSHTQWMDGYMAFEKYAFIASQAYIPVKDILYSSFLLLSNPHLATQTDLHKL